MTDGPTARSHDGNSHDVNNDVAIHSRGLAKRRGDRWTVDHLDLNVPTGALSGFVGPNGAGKSTTLRMLLGLVRPTEGRATVLGQPLGAPERYLHRVGAMIEGPTFHPGLTGRGNLTQLSTLRRLPRRRVEEVLGQVGMADRADEPFAAYSLGMKQRLGIAAALLPKPDLLILDEPTNGLDPAGIREIRSLLKELAGSGMTVFVSSHLLSEVEQICDHLVMIRNGRLLFQGHVTELLAAGGSRIVLCPEHAGDTIRLVGLIRDAGLRADVTPAVEGMHREALGVTTEEHGAQGVYGVAEITVHAPVESAADLNRLAAWAGITLRGLRTYRPSLEETFLQATGTTDGDINIDPDLKLKQAGDCVPDPLTRTDSAMPGSAMPGSGASGPGVSGFAVPHSVPAIPQPHGTVPGHRLPGAVPAGGPRPWSTS